MIDDRRLGRFMIKVSMINNKPDLVLALLRNVIVLEASASVVNDAVVYLGISPAFHPAAQGEKISYYTADIVRVESTIPDYEITWRRN